MDFRCREVRVVNDDGRVDVMFWEIWDCPLTDGQSQLSVHSAQSLYTYEIDDLVMSSRQHVSASAVKSLYGLLVMYQDSE